MSNIVTAIKEVTELSSFMAELFTKLEDCVLPQDMPLSLKLIITHLWFSLACVLTSSLGTTNLVPGLKCAQIVLMAIVLPALCTCCGRQVGVTDPYTCYHCLNCKVPKVVKFSRRYTQPPDR